VARLHVHEEPALGVVLEHAPLPVEPRLVAEALAAGEGPGPARVEVLAPGHLRLTFEAGASLRALRCAPGGSWRDRRPSAARLADLLHRLRAHGVPALRPLGHLASRARPARTASDLLLEDRPLAPLEAGLSGATFTERRVRLHALGALLARLHASGLAFGALDEHALGWEGAEPWLVDPRGLVPIAPGRAPEARALVPAAERLGLSRTDRARVLRALCRHHHDPRAARRVAAAPPT
jgi:hypothetical protein